MIIGWLIVLGYSLFVFYLAYVTLRVAKGNGKLAQAPMLVRGIAWSVIIIGVILDVTFNIFVGSLLFLEPPELKRLTFTARCQKWMPDTEWRGRLANWFCEGWLNPFEDKHC